MDWRFLLSLCALGQYTAMSAPVAAFKLSRSLWYEKCCLWSKSGSANGRDMQYRSHQAAACEAANAG